MHMKQWGILYTLPTQATQFISAVFWFYRLIKNFLTDKEGNKGDF